MPPLGRQDRAEGPRRPGGGHSAALRGWGAGRSGEGLCLALGRAKSSAGEQGGSILVRTRFSGKTGIHFKISAQKGSRAVLKPGGAPGLYRSPLGALQRPPPPTPGRTLATLVVCWERYHLCYEAGAAGEMLLLFSEHRGVPAVLTAGRGHPFQSGSASPRYHGEGWRRKPGLMQVYSTSEKLSWEKEKPV